MKAAFICRCQAVVPLPEPETPTAAFLDSPDTFRIGNATAGAGERE